MGSFRNGICRYCGQQSVLGTPADDQESADIAASENCNCPTANTERQIKKGKERVLQLFGDEADKLGFLPIEEGEIIDHLNFTVERVAHHQLASATLNLSRYGRAKIGMTTKRKIKVERQVVQAYQLEE